MALVQSYCSALRAEFCEDTTDSSFDDSDNYVLEVTLSVSETLYDDDIEMEMDTLMDGNDRAERAFMKIQTIYEDAEPLDPQLEHEPPKNENKHRSLHYVEKSSQHAVEAVRIGHTERRRSIGNSAA